MPAKRSPAPSLYSIDEAGKTLIRHAPTDTQSPVDLILEQGRIGIRAHLPHRHIRPVLLVDADNQVAPNMDYQSAKPRLAAKSQLPQGKIHQKDACLERIKP